MRASPPPGNVVFCHCVPLYTTACPVIGVVITTSVRSSSVLAPPDTTRLPDPSTKLPFIVLIFVPDTRLSCFVASPAV